MQGTSELEPAVDRLQLDLKDAVDAKQRQGEKFLYKKLNQTIAGAGPIQHGDEHYDEKWRVSNRIEHDVSSSPGTYTKRHLIYITISNFNVTTLMKRHKSSINTTGITLP